MDSFILHLYPFLLKETLGRGRIVNLFKGSSVVRNASLEGRRRVPKARRDGRFFKGVDGRGQKAVGHLRRRFEAFGDGLGKVLFEVGEEHAAQSLGNKGHVGEVGVCWYYVGGLIFGI